MPDLDQQFLHLSVPPERGHVGKFREGHRKLYSEQLTEQSKIPPASPYFALDPEGTLHRELSVLHLAECLWTAMNASLHG